MPQDVAPEPSTLDVAPDKSWAIALVPETAEAHDILTTKRRRNRQQVAAQFTEVAADEEMHQLQKALFDIAANFSTKAESTLRRYGFILKRFESYVAESQWAHFVGRELDPEQLIGKMPTMSWFSLTDIVPTGCWHELQRLARVLSTTEKIMTAWD